MASRHAPSWQPQEQLPYLRKLLITVAVVLVVTVAILLRDVWLIAFASVLVAVGLGAAAGRIRKWTHLGQKASLTIACLLVVAVLGLAFFLAWPQIQTQLPNLLDRVAEAANQIEDAWGIRLPSTADEIAETIGGMGDQLLTGLMSVVGALVTIGTTFLLILVAGTFIAAEPTRYRDGAVLLFPKAWHAKVREAFDKVGDGLKLWIRAQLVAMVVVGVLTGLGAWAIGLPSPLALGLIAGLGEFVPIIGPFVAVLPALLIAFAEDTTLLLWTIALYVVVQQFEANLLTPMLQRRIVELPPVLFLFSLVALGIVFGIPGIVVAAPLSVSLYILIRELYVRSLLKEETLMEKPEDVPLKDTPATPEPAQRVRRRAVASRSATKRREEAEKAKAAAKLAAATKR
ncbi:MAG: AI-2E family transporter [Bauldia sp.]|nr:AI-2E family transporter [Bauldia sp.]MCW5716523.1 AI-2E family transporter [Bauldia sp.]